MKQIQNKSSRKRILSTNSENNKDNEFKPQECLDLNGMNNCINNQNDLNIIDIETNIDNNTTNNKVVLKSSLKSQNSKKKILDITSKKSYFQYTKIKSDDNINEDNNNGLNNNENKDYTLFKNIDDEVFIYLDTNDNDKNDFLDMVKRNNIMINSDYYTDLLSKLLLFNFVR